MCARAEMESEITAVPTRSSSSPPPATLVLSHLGTSEKERNCSPLQGRLDLPPLTTLSHLSSRPLSELSPLSTPLPTFTHSLCQNMCYEYGSLDQGNANCIVCKLLGTNKANCPHKSLLRVCQDRQNHSQPIVFYTNAEYNIFNGCGYCKWAKRFPPGTEIDKLNNKGWPGCCRPPRLGEMELIDDADWPVVSRRYGLPDRSALRDRPQRPVSLSKAASRSGASARRGSIDVSPKEERGASSSPHRRGSPRIADPPTTEGSPRRSADALATAVPASAVNGPYRAILNPVGRPSPSSSQQSISTSYIGIEEREPGMYHTRPIPRNGQAMPAPPANGTANGAIEQIMARSSSIRRAVPAPSSVSSSSSSSGYAESASSNGSSSSSGASSVASYDPRILRDIQKEFENMSLSSTSSNRESIITVTSDGAFTDYLSDESEAEMQRQAEARAAQLRRLRAEEAEFNAARRGLANIDLQTPIAWAPTQPQPYNPSAYARR